MRLLLQNPGQPQYWVAVVVFLGSLQPPLRNVGDGDLEVILDAVVDRFLDAVGLEVEGEPVGGLLGLGVDEVVGTVPSAEGVVVVVSDEMPDELMVVEVPLI